jgi:hypothetical protein
MTVANKTMKEDTVPVYFFSCNSAKNIKIGYENRLWAVPAGDSTWINARHTRSRDMLPGSLGLLYCSEKNNQHFTVPFKVKTQPRNIVVSEPWPEPWALPFEIEPLGPPSKSEPLSTVKRDWAILKNSPNAANELRLMGAAAFLPVSFAISDWDKVIRHLAFRDDT